MRKPQHHRHLATALQQRSQRHAPSLLRTLLLLAICVGVLCIHPARVFAESVDPVEVAIDAHGDLALGDVQTIERVVASQRHTHIGGSGDDGAKQMPEEEDTQQGSGWTEPATQETSPKPHQNDPPPERQFEKTALLKELEAIELMIKLQEKKLDLLERMRSEGLREDREAANTLESGRKSRPQHYDDLIERKIEAMTAAAVQELLSSSSHHVFATLFVEKAVISAKGPVVDMKLMKLRTTGQRDLLVMALASGIIEFYLTPSLFLLRMQSEEGRTIRSIDLDLHGEFPTLAIMYEQPRAAVYGLELTQDGRHLLGAQPEHAASFPTDSVRFFASTPGLPYSLRVAHLCEIALPSTPTAFAMTRTARRSVISIGSDDGGIAFFALNGTQLHKMETSSTIETMAARRNLIGFNNGSDTVLFPLSRGRDAEMVVCPGSTGTVTSIAFDPAHVDLVYAGTSYGELLAYSLKDSGRLSLENEHSGGSCKMVARAIIRGPSPSSRATPLKLYALRGYLIASGPSEIAVFNVSRDHDGSVTMESTCVLNTLTTSPPPEPSRIHPFLPLAVSEGNLVTNFAYAKVTNPNGESEIKVFQSLLPSKIERADSLWTGFIYAGTIISVVLMCQFCVRRQPQSQSAHGGVDPWEVLKSRKTAPAGSFGGGDAAIDADDDLSGYDFERLAREMKADASRSAGRGGARGGRDIEGSRRGGRRMGGKNSRVSDRDRFGPSYDSLSDDLKRKIGEARKETLECSFDDREF